MVVVGEPVAGLNGKMIKNKKEKKRINF